MKRVNTNTARDKQPAVFLRISRVAELLDISRPSVYNLIHSGELKGCIRVGSRLRIPASAVEELAERGKI
jgi:excisionase family DNA binding protein